MFWIKGVFFKSILKNWFCFLNFERKLACARIKRESMLDFTSIITNLPIKIEYFITCWRKLSCKHSEQSKEYLWKHMYQLWMLPKMVGLRSYYGQLKHKVNSSKKWGWKWWNFSAAMAFLWQYWQLSKIFCIPMPITQIKFQELTYLLKKLVASYKETEHNHKRRWHSTDKT